MSAHGYWNRRTLEAIQIRRKDQTMNLDCGLHISPVWNPQLDATWTDLSSPNYCTHHDWSNFYPPWRHFTHHHQDVMPLVYKQHLACILSAFQLKHPGLFDLVLRILLKKLTRLLVKRSWSMGVSNISGWKVIARVAHLGAMPSWHYVHHQHVHSVSPRVLNNSWN